MKQTLFKMSIIKKYVLKPVYKNLIKKSTTVELIKPI